MLSVNIVQVLSGSDDRAMRTKKIDRRKTAKSGVVGSNNPMQNTTDRQLLRATIGLLRQLYRDNPERVREMAKTDKIAALFLSAIEKDPSINQRVSV